jgi:hypothetical protein
MIILYETKPSDSTIANYRQQGYRVASIFDNPYIRQGESVGILLDKIYKPTIDFIDNLLYNNDRVNISEYKPDKDGKLIKHRKQSNKVINKLTLKYDNKYYNLDSLSDWKFTHQSETDQIKTKTEYHIIYKTYLDNVKEYNELQKQIVLKQQYELYNVNVPDEELDNYINAFAYLYDIEVDMTDTIEKLRAYKQIQYYQDIEMPYVNERVIEPDSEPMFAGKFNIQYEEPIEIISFWDQKYMDDFIYKNEDEETY